MLVKIFVALKLSNGLHNAAVFFLEHSCDVSAAYYGAVVVDEDSERRRRDSEFVCPYTFNLPAIPSASASTKSPRPLWGVLPFAR